MNCVVFPTVNDELNVVWSGQLRNKHLPLGEVSIRGLTPLHRSLPSEINVSSWVSRQSWELSVPDELQYMLVTYKTVGYKEKVYQSCSLASVGDGKETALMRSFAQHLASERVGVGYASFDSYTHMILIPRPVRTNRAAKSVVSTASNSHSFFHLLICYEPLLVEAIEDAVEATTASDGLDENNVEEEGTSALMEIAIESHNDYEKASQCDSHVQQDFSQYSYLYGSYMCEASYVDGLYTNGSYMDGSYMDGSCMDGSYVDDLYAGTLCVDGSNAYREMDVNLYGSRSGSYGRTEQDISFYPSTQEQDELAAVNETPANEVETPLLASLRSVLDVVKHRRTQSVDTFTFPSDGYEHFSEDDANYDGSHQPVELAESDDARSEYGEEQHTRSPSSYLSEDEEDTDARWDVTNGHPNMQLFRSCLVRPRKSDYKVNRPPRRGFASCYRSASRSSSLNLSRYMINSSTRLQPKSRSTTKHEQYT